MAYWLLLFVNCGLRHYDDVGGWWLAASLAGLAKKVAARCLKLKEISIPQV